MSAQGPLVLGLGLRGLGLRVWGQGLTILWDDGAVGWLIALTVGFSPYYQAYFGLSATGRRDVFLRINPGDSVPVLIQMEMLI